MARKGRSKLAKLMSEKHVRAMYVPTAEEVAKWFAIINREVFGGQLEPFSRVRIRRMHGAWAECTPMGRNVEGLRHSRLDLNHHVKSKRHLVSIICHEMVHHHQWTVLGICDHGETFREWKDEFRQFGVVLNIRQRT